MKVGHRDGYVSVCNSQPRNLMVLFNEKNPNVLYVQAVVTHITI